MIRKLQTLLGVAIAAIVTALELGCTPTPRDAAVAYGADLNACTAQASSRAADDACRANVDATWGVDAGYGIAQTVSTKDGGK
jgi:hypothetical protein